MKCENRLVRVKPPFPEADRSFVDPVTLGKILWYGGLCNGCARCFDVCPQGAVTISQGHELVKHSDTPCMTACPASVDIARYVRFIAAGKFDEAVAVVRERLPFPAVCGYVCTSPCEIACRRGWLDDPVLIRELKRAAAEHDTGLWKKSLKPASPTGHRAAVIGSGPAGLTAAYFLARKGHDVTVYEAVSQPGGKMMHSIRDWHLPKDIVIKEIREIEAAGVKIKTNHNVASIEALFDQGFEAVLSAAGLHRLPKIPPINVKTSIKGEAFLAGGGDAIMTERGNRVVILGGGKTAFDCALKARDLGAATIHLVSIEYRGEGESDTWQSELAVSGGAVVHSWRVFPRVIRRGGHIVGVEHYKIRAFGFDRHGRFRADPIVGSERFVAADVVIDALGMDSHPDCVFQRPGYFSAGDAVSELRSVIEAIAAGRWVASAMDRYLGGNGDIEEALAALEGWVNPVMTPSTVPRPDAPLNMLPGGYAQVEFTLPENAAIAEAGRCLSCDLSYSVNKFNIDMDLCNLCGECIDDCNRKALRFDGCKRLGIRSRVTATQLPTRQILHRWRLHPEQAPLCYL